MTDDELQDQFDDFYEDFFCELAKYGQLTEMHVCDNIGDHLIGNVYARYEWEEEAQRAVDALNDKWYNREYMPERRSEFRGPRTELLD